MKKKHLIAFFIVGFGALTSLWIAFDSPAHTKNDSPVSFDAILKKTSSNLLFTLASPPANQRTARQDESSDNLTENVMRLYGNEVLRLNPKYSGVTGQITLPSQTVFDHLLSSQIENYKIEIPSFSSKDVRLIQTDSEARITQYFSEIRTIIAENADEQKGFLMALATYVTQNDQKTLQHYIASAYDTIKKMLEVQVPAQWSTFHVELLTAYQKRLTLAEIVFENTFSDPLKAIVALNEVTNLVEKEDALFATIYEYAMSKNR